MSSPNGDPRSPADRARAARRARRGYGTRILRIAGIDIRVHGSWLLWLLVLTAISRTALVDEIAPGVSDGGAWVLAVLFAIPLSACIVAHELAHALVARAYRLKVRAITLFLFGGVAQIEREAPGPAAEFRIAVAGPLASLTLASVLSGVARVLEPGRGLHGPWGTMAMFNLMLAAFNLLPAFPMDGGRILRSALWAGGGNRARATRRAVAAGRAFAFLFIGAGGALFVTSAFRGGSDATSGLWLGLIGWFLFNAAGTAGRVEGGEHPNQPSPLGGGPPGREV